MNTKQILSLAVIATLPLSVHADPTVGPAAVPTNGTPVVATASAPYVTQTPTADDATHIASTAYVKGAYNDTIAAVNKVNSEKQDKLMWRDTEISTMTEPDQVAPIMDDFIGARTMGGESFAQDMVDGLSAQLLSTGGVIGAIGAAVDLQRVLVYTTWENDNAKNAVPLANQIGWANQIY